jgi:hypothetical protein
MARSACHRVSANCASFKTPIMPAKILRAAVSVAHAKASRPRST